MDLGKQRNELEGKGLSFNPKDQKKNVMNQYERDLLYITDKMNTNVITKWTEVDLKDQSGPN